MPVYAIAGLRVAIDPRRPLLRARAAKFLADAPGAAPVPDIVLPPDEEGDLRRAQDDPRLSVDEWEYVLTGARFYAALIDHGGFMVHASAVALDGTAYLFAADPGVGKSTHAALWRAAFGEDRVRILNDDKPAVRLEAGRFRVHGTPFSGKTDENRPESAPLGGLCLLERAASDWIRRVDAKDALGDVLKQVLRPRDAERMDRLLPLVDRLLREVPIARMGCTVDVGAAEMARRFLAERRGEGGDG